MNIKNIILIKIAPIFLMSILLSAAVLTGCSDTLNGFSVTGKITDQDDNAVSNITVIADNGTEYRTATADDGSFSFSNLPAGNYAFSAIRTGWVIVPNLDGPLKLRWEQSAEVSFKAWNLDNSLPIAVIQGTGARSPLEGQKVYGIEGVVTKIQTEEFKGFFMQSIVSDGNDLTSDGIFVKTQDPDFSGPRNLPTVPYDLAKGDKVKVSGEVIEYVPKDYLGYNNGFLTVTMINEPVVEIIEVDYTSSHPAPEPVVLGSGGRIPPSGTSGQEIINFFEPLEGMRVTMMSPVAIGPISYGNIAVLPEGGAYADPDAIFTNNGGMMLLEKDLNPERMYIYYDQFSDVLLAGTTFTPTDVTGVVNYTGDGIYTIEPADDTEIGNANIPGVTKETTLLSHQNRSLRVAVYNVENFGPDYSDGEPDYSDQTRKAANISEDYVDKLLNPDISVFVEMGDDYPTNVIYPNTKYTIYVPDGHTSSEGNIEILKNKIYTRNSSLRDTLAYCDIEPEDGCEGGKPGMNIRVGIMYRKDRVSFTPKGNAKYDDAVVPVLDSEGKLCLNYNPGRIIDSSFSNSRRPLVAEFEFDGEKVIIIGVHLKSKSSDGPLYGVNQPPIFSSEEKRLRQAKAVSAFVSQCLKIDPDANIIVTGDFNDFPFSVAVKKVLSAGLYDLTAEQIPINERYSYSYYGNSQQIDYMLVSENIHNTALSEIDILHINADIGWSDQHSDHDPLLGRFTW